MRRSLDLIVRSWGDPLAGPRATPESATDCDHLYASAVGLLLRLVLVDVARRVGVLGAEEATQDCRPSRGSGGRGSSGTRLAWTRLEACCERLAERAAVRFDSRDPRSSPGWLLAPRAFPLLARAAVRLPDATMAALFAEVRGWLGASVRDRAPVATVVDVGSPPLGGQNLTPGPRTTSGASGSASPPAAFVPRAADVAALGHLYEATREYRVERSSDGRLRLVRGAGRRAAGVHYTPADLAAQVVRPTLAPLLAAVAPPAAPRARPGGAEPSSPGRAATAVAGGAESRADDAPNPPRDPRVADLAMGSGIFLAEAVCSLSDALRARASAVGNGLTELEARRHVLEHCVYGVDLDPLAVELGRWSLWLLGARPEAGAPRDAMSGRPNAPRRGRWPIAKIASHLFVGDALVGLGPSGPSVVSGHGATDAEGSARFRRSHAPHAALPGVSPTQAILAADLAVAARFAGSRRPLPSLLRDALAEVRRCRTSGDEARLRAQAERLLGGRRCVHWPLHFGDVLRSGGFDAIVGNPPFLGGKRISEVLGVEYNRWLGRTHDGTSRNTDLVAHFFRRGFDLLRPGGCLGLIATNTIAQGATCEAGLAWIVEHGGTIYEAEPELIWPGDAAVVVSVVHLCRGAWRGSRRLGGRPVSTIGPRLQPSEPRQRPRRLASNRGRAFVGCYVLGMGFTFDDEHRKQEAWPLSLMHRLLAEDPRNALRLAPYIGGEEVGESPTHEPRRFVIDFGELAEHDARQWPALFALVEQRVKPFRLQKDARRYPRMVHEWWKFWNARPKLRAAVAGLPRVLVTPRVARHSAFTFLPPGIVCSEQLIVFALDRFAAFALLQSSVHEVWARCYSSTLGRGLRYTPSSCFETFPFPDDWQGARGEALDRIGAAYYLQRSAAMRLRGEGLSRVYGRLHDARCRDADVLELRRLHAALDRTVCEAYGWSDLALDYRWDAPAGRRGTASRRRDDIEASGPTGLGPRARADVLSRLAALNAELTARRPPATRGR